MAKHLHKLLRLFLSFLPQTRNESSQRKGKKIFIFLKQSQFERNFAIEKLVRTIKLIEYHLEDLGFRYERSIDTDLFFLNLLFRRIQYRFVDKFRTISTARSLIYVNANALLYKLVERLPIV